METQDMPSQHESVPCPERAKECVQSLKLVPSVIAIVMYGSTARGRATPLSDTDICIVTRPGQSREEWEFIMSHSGPTLDVVLFQDLAPALQYRVMNEGKILCCNDAAALHRIFADALMNYLDLKPFIERNARRILNIPHMQS